MAYNLTVPTPFYHLSIAADLLEHSKLSSSLRTQLNRHSSDFMFGKTAPDVQVVSGQTREETHFYTLPPDGKMPAWKQMMAANQRLASSGELPAQQAVFVAGYICHLQADEKWIVELFIPYFGPDADWADFQQRLYLHNVLRTYLDQQVLEKLPEDTGVNLQKSRPNNWLPFVEDKYFQDWQNFLCEQLQPGAKTKTAEVFANRQGLPLQDFTELLSSEARMEAEFFSRIPRQRLAEFRQTLLADNLQLLEEYLT